MRFAKGHGSGNDFLILPDQDATELTPGLVARLCDRRFGLGADGVLRVVRDGAAGWFMDYRNADGSVAEMCGNGIRVFAAYLLARGLADGPALEIGTRAGPRQVRAGAGGAITVDMGMPHRHGQATAVIGGRKLDGLHVSLGNPHLACLVDEPVAGLDLAGPPAVDPAAFPGGVNVEVARILATGHIEMRVHERGSGATLSCGTGAVAAAVAARAAAGRADSWDVDVPGGRLTVTLTGTTSLLTGPAVIVAEGELCADWLAGRPATAAAR
ncbi:MAG TPA: diaminopimelate epimerase [Streptosporangiaceae bacterium]|jgi:diaminopimelate epimerase